jgi:K+:H+ antiporter
VGRCPTILINRRAVLAKLLAILALVIVAKFLIGTGIVKLFGYPLKTAALVGTGLTQIGEF